MGTITRGLANNVTTAGRVAASGISNSSVTAITSFAGITGADGSFTRLSTTTVSSSTASVTLTGMDSTYKLYLIDYSGVAPVTDSVHLQCKFSSDGGTTFHAGMGSGLRQYNGESAGTEAIGMNGSAGAVQGGTFTLITDCGNDADMGQCGQIWISNPASTSLTKMFRSTNVGHHSSDLCWTSWIDGYVNTTTAIDSIQFLMASGNIAKGSFRIYGVTV